MKDAVRRFKANIFQTLAHPTRVAILEQLNGGELSAGELIARLGVEQANASQHLAVLRSRLLVANRKSGNQVFYSARDPLILDVLDTMRRYFPQHLASLALLDEIKQNDKQDEGLPQPLDRQPGRPQSMRTNNGQAHDDPDGTSPTGRRCWEDQIRSNFVGQALGRPPGLRGCPAPAFRCSSF